MMQTWHPGASGLFTGSEELEAAGKVLAMFAAQGEIQPGPHKGLLMMQAVAMMAAEAL